MGIFLDSDTIRPLYDVHDGGPPNGFRCKLSANQIDNTPFRVKQDGRYCAKITRTLTGMHMHQVRVHGIKPQMEMQFESLRSRENQQER